eukprot:6280593-Prymnesium_polylepis.1
MANTTRSIPPYSHNAQREPALTRDGSSHISRPRRTPRGRKKCNFVSRARRPAALRKGYGPYLWCTGTLHSAHAVAPQRATDAPARLG